MEEVGGINGIKKKFTLSVFLTGCHVQQKQLQSSVLLHYKVQYNIHAHSHIQLSVIDY